jgi:hypothetical protein
VDASFSVVLWQGDERTVIPSAVEQRPAPVPCLTIALLATAEPDALLLEARCGH